MTMRDEVRALTEAYSKRNSPLLADDIVREAQDADAFPALHAHIWEVSETVLAHEARLARAHRLLISIRFVSTEGENTRLLIHTPGHSGYRPASYVAANIDLATIKLRQLSDDVARARGRLSEFKHILGPGVAEEIDESIKNTERQIDIAISEREKAAAA